MAEEFRLVLCNTPPDAAEKLARVLVEERLAACVNIIPGVKSVYRWEGKIHVDTEHTLLIKTSAHRLGVMTQRIKELHPYELPEVISLSLNNGEGEKRYLEWVSAEVNDPPEGWERPESEIVDPMISGDSSDDALSQRRP